MGGELGRARAVTRRADGADARTVRRRRLSDDNDGDIDIFEADSAMKLHRNDGTGFFYSMSAPPLTSGQGMGFNVKWYTRGRLGRGRAIRDAAALCG